MATTAPALICPQGHGPGVAGSRFCTFCGASLVAATSSGKAPLAPGQPVPANPVAAQPANGGWQPVNTGPAQANTAAPAPNSPAAPWQPAPATSTQPPPGAPWQPPARSTTTQAPPAVSTPTQVPASLATKQPSPCKVCGNTGAGLSEDTLVCAECGWLRPLLPGYTLDR